MGMPRARGARAGERRAVSTVRGVLEACGLVCAIMLPWFLLDRPAPAPAVEERIYYYSDPELLERVYFLEEQLSRCLEERERALAPYRMEIVRSGGGERPRVRNVVRDK